MPPGAEKAGSEAVWGVACLVEPWGRWGRDTHNLGRTSGKEGKWGAVGGHGPQAGDPAPL